MQRNVITTYGYDALNRMTSKSYSDGTPAVNYSFDSTSATCTKGRLIGVANSNSTTNLTPYDCLGRVTASSQVTSGQTYTFGYGYNLAGALTSETYPSGRVVTTAYDNASRVSAVASGTTTYVQAIQYAPHGGEVSWTLGNGAPGSQQFNPRLEPTSIAVGTALSLGFYYCPNGGASCSTNNGNLMRQTIASSPPTFSVIQNYDSIPYDGVNRLKSVTEGTSSRSYGYDAWGNRWVSANTGLFLSPFTPTVSTNFDSKNRLYIQGAVYDNGLPSGPGNQTTIGGFTMAYNGENLMTSSAIGGVATQYGYDGNNRRVKKTTGTAQTVYVHDAAGELAAEYAPVTDPDPPCRTCYLLNDHLGSTRAMLDEAQALVARYDYLPFGEQIPTGYDGRTALWGAASAWDGRTPDGVTEKFTGKERDSETGLDYFGARYLSGAQGRFGSPDPENAGADVLNPQSLNGYVYALNNPLRFVDSDGFDVLDTKYHTIGKVSLKMYTFYENVDIAGMLTSIYRPQIGGLGLTTNEALQGFKQNQSSFWYPGQSPTSTGVTDAGGCTLGCYNFFEERVVSSLIQVQFNYDSNDRAVSATITRAPNPLAQSNESGPAPMIVTASALPGGLPPAPKIRGPVKVDKNALRKLTPDQLDALWRAALGLSDGELGNAILKAVAVEINRRSEDSPRSLPSGGKCTTADGMTANCQGPF